jgi:DNA-binding PadR family transcriptional regulator
MFGSHFQENPRQSRLFKKGDLKYVILDIIKDKSSHGYDITGVLEERFHGLYSPSAGSIYPILQSLENSNYVTCCSKDGKKIYTITGEGERFLSVEKETTDRIKERFNGLWDCTNKEYLRDVRAVMSQLLEIRSILGRTAVANDREKINKIKEILARASAEIKSITEDENRQ